MILNYKDFGTGTPLIILHGLFGSLDNWQTLGKRFAEKYHVFLVDQRNHGKSPHSDEFSYPLLAEDLKEFIATQQLKNPFVLGHSMGGKTAMQLALNNPELLGGIIVADMAPKVYEPHHDRILEGLNALNLDVATSRRDAEKMLEPYIPEWGVRQFLLKNLYWKDKEHLALRFNLPVLEQKMPDIVANIDGGANHFSNPSLFIRGTKSAYVLDTDKPLIRELFPNAEFADMDCGHWLHAEKPDQFYEIVMEFMARHDV